MQATTVSSPPTFNRMPLGESRSAIPHSSGSVSPSSQLQMHVDIEEQLPVSRANKAEAEADDGVLVAEEQTSNTTLQSPRVGIAGESVANASSYQQPRSESPEKPYTINSPNGVRQEVAENVEMKSPVANTASGAPGPDPGISIEQLLLTGAFNGEGLPPSAHNVDGAPDLLSSMNADELINLMANFITSSTNAIGGGAIKSPPLEPTAPVGNNLFDSLNLLSLLGSAGLGQGADLMNSLQPPPQPMSSKSNLFAFPSFANPSGNNLIDSDPATTAAAAAAALFGGSAAPAATLPPSPNKSLDSWCDICKKNLCNRYFLKTHMQKKHGITMSTGGATAETSTDTAVEKSFGTTLSTENGHTLCFTSGGQSSVIVNSNSAENGNDHHTSSPLKNPKPEPEPSPQARPAAAENWKWSGLATPTQSAHYDPSHNPLGKLLSLNQSHPPPPPISMANRIASPIAVKSPQVKRAAMPSGILSPPQHHPFPPPSSFRNPPPALNQCNQCEREFDSHLALIQHQILQHGSISSIADLIPIQPQQPSRSSSFSLANSALSPSREPLMLPLGFPLTPFPLFPPQFSNLLAGISASETHASASMPLDSSNAAQSAAALMAKLSGTVSASNTNGLTASSTSSTAITLSRGEPQFSSPCSNPSTPSLQAGQGGSGGKAQLQAKRNYSSTSRNYCDICNKDVCNKYFLRTHMLKMHNIVIDENKSIIANIDTLEKEKSGVVTFRCDICLCEMKTRNDLRQHKKEAHGVVPMLNTPPPNSSVPGQTASSPSQKLDQKLSSSMGQSSTHFFSSSTEDEHGGDEMMAVGATAVSGDNSGGEHGLLGIRRLKLEPPAPPLTNMELILNSLAGTHNSTLDMRGGKTAESAEGGESGPISSSSAASSAGQLATALLTSNGATSTASSESPHPHQQLAATCRYCSVKFEDELKMQLHSIKEHSVEILSQALAFTSGGGFNTAQMSNSASAIDDNDVITQVALQMLQANQQLLLKGHRGGGGMMAPEAGDESDLPKRKIHKCNLCHREYKSRVSLLNHTRLVHHNFVAKLSPSKRNNKRPTVALSPRKARRLRTCFTCMKCQCRFSTRAECTQHVIGHLRQASLSGAEHNDSPLMKRAKVDNSPEGVEAGHLFCGENGEKVDGKMEGKEEENLAHQYVREETFPSSGQPHPTNAGRGDDAVGQVVSEIHEELSNRTMAAVHNGGSNGRKEESQKLHSHSHTSGSASPLSAHSLPEAYAHVPGCAPPIHSPKGSSEAGSTSTSSHLSSDRNGSSRPYAVQSFVLRKIGSEEGGNTDPRVQSHLLDELVAHLPVRSSLSEPIRVTFELTPQLDVDAQVQQI